MVKLALHIMKPLRRRMGNKQSRAGFTMIELIVVTAILSTLLAIAIPSSQYLHSEWTRHICRENRERLLMVMQSESWSLDDGMAEYGLKCPAEGDWYLDQRVGRPVIECTECKKR